MESVAGSSDAAEDSDHLQIPASHAWAAAAEEDPFHDDWPYWLCNGSSSVVSESAANDS